MLVRATPSFSWELSAYDTRSGITTLSVVQVYEIVNTKLEGFSQLLTYPSSIVMFARASNLSCVTKKLLLSTMVFIFSGLRLLIVKFMEIESSLPIIRGLGLRLTLS